MWRKIWTLSLRTRGVQAEHPRLFTTTPGKPEKALPPRPKILETEIDESFLRGSGPGGQKINKTSSAVQIKHLPTGIVVKSQETRSRESNRKLARNLLAEKLDQIEKGEGSRMAIKGARATKKKASAGKKARRKYRKLEEEKGVKGRVEGVGSGGDGMSSAVSGDTGASYTGGGGGEVGPATGAG
ncbi:hypothetical protein LTR62_007236 [Meristemomyces frigidus]|uniref:Prokaryotic-type class I peptide chain release factors domain-containing protein n=1 Tax=Meristemomyces frigidus TaxID=1508187 RepID=A0AAN7TCG8_9PEZI|nr:hypothetical protein LTR62_007236 [Meristemomyces frigidus]